MITYRIEKGSALTYQELDDNFREIAAIPNVRWQKLKNTIETELVEDEPGTLTADVAWATTDHTDAVHYNFNGTSTTIMVKNGIYRVNADVVIEYHADSSLDNNVRLELLVNDIPISSTYKLPQTEHLGAFESLKINTIVVLNVSDTIKLKVTAENENASYKIADQKGELVMEWAGYNP
tara:strand:+ start:287 stop:823 length:537 start_codon:yes stop_codon:yes gene_type:complete